MRKFILLILAAMMLFMCASCGGGVVGGTDPSTNDSGTNSGLPEHFHIESCPFLNPLGF